MKHSLFIKTKSCSCAILAAVLCTGCVKDVVVEPEERIVTVLTADVHTKTVLQNDVNVLWKIGRAHV